MTFTVSAASTKTELLAHIASLESALAATPQAEPSTIDGNRLVQRLWIGDRYEIGRTQGNALKISFSGQVSAKLQDGTRVYGAYKNFVAYGDQAADAKDILEGTDRLVEIQAFEKPWSNNSKKSDWIILSINPVQRSQPAAQSGEAVLATEPIPAQYDADAEVDF
jgi:hypothetical protein